MQQDLSFGTRNRSEGLLSAKQELQRAADAAGIGHLSTHAFRHTYRTWLDSVGTPIGVQQKLMRHADIRTTMNIYGDAGTADMAEAHGKIVGLALNGTGNGTERVQVIEKMVGAIGFEPMTSTV